MSSHLQMLQEYRDLDLALDPFPFSGGYTSCEALWMGVPVVTLPQERVVSRQTLSVLTNIGLEQELAASDPGDYVTRAVSLAMDHGRLRELRFTLRHRMARSPLCDPQQFTRDLEVMFQQTYATVRQEQSGSRIKIFRKGTTSEASPGRSSADSETRSLGFIHRTRQPLSRRVVRLDPPRNSVLDPVLYCIAASQHELEAFHAQSQLGRSLATIPGPLRPGLLLLPLNRGEDGYGLSEFYNHAIATLPDQAHLCFVHDDIYIHDWNICSLVKMGLERYQILGVVGSSGGSRQMPSWVFDLIAPQKLCKRRDLQESGAINHLTASGNHLSYYGPCPQDCEQIDGCFIATSSQVLRGHDLRFDPQFRFHCYDSDFCRSALEKGIRIGTWPVSLSHQSGGKYDARWVEAATRWKQKWS